MGMPIVVDVRDEVDEAVLDQLFDWFREVDERFSTYKGTSEISRLNRGEMHVRECHPDVREVLARCDELREETDGYFDHRYRAFDDIDPSGLVKGWSVDRGTRILDDAGLTNYSVNAGGDIALRGAALPGHVWSVGIEHPRLRDRVAAVIETNDIAIATSGAYARGDHVVDPHTGNPPTGVLSVTIVGPNVATADAYATAAFAMGQQGPAWTARLAPYEALTILADETSLLTNGFPRKP